MWDFFVEKTMSRCPAILNSGARKDEVCGRPLLWEDSPIHPRFCHYHRNWGDGSKVHRTNKTLATPPQSLAMSHDPESRATPVYNDIDTWPDEFTDDEISALVSPHVRVGAKAHWPTLGFNFRNDRANDLRYASQILNDLIYPGVECSLADFMKSRPKFDLRALDKDKACDMSGFANFICCTVLALQVQLNALSIKVKQPVVLFPVIDEGQLLDEIPDGARQTLCLFRELQLEVFKAGGDNMLLGIMTGINPDLSLPNATFGVNVSFECALHDVNGFVEISNQLLKERPYTPSQKDLVAKILYPFIRDVEDFATKRPLKDLNFQVGTPPPTMSCS